MMVAVLLGALSLGACVDDNESASVTDLREAKAEQLRSIAEMNKAEAQAKLIYANAEAELKTAEANLKQALADKLAAEALIKQLEAQMKQDTYDAELAAQLAEAEKNRLEAEKEIARIQGEMQKNQLTLEREIANLQKYLLQAQLELQKKQDEVDNAAMDRLETLAKKYSTLLYTYTEEKNLLLTKKTELSNLNADMVDIKEEAQKTIEENTAAIALIDQQIALFQQYANYQGENLDAMKEEYELLKSQIDQARDAEQNANNQYEEAYDALISNEKLSTMLATLEENPMIDMYKYSWNYTYSAPGFYINFSWYNPVRYYTSNASGTVEKEGYRTFYGYDQIELEVEAQDLRMLQLDVDNAIDALNISGLTTAINAANTGTKALLDAAKAATVAAKTLWDATPSDQTLENDYRNCLYREEQAQYNYDQSVQDLKNAQETKAQLEEWLAIVSGSTTELEKAAEEYNAAVAEANEPVAALCFAYQDAEANTNELRAEHSALKAVLYGRTSEYTTLTDYVVAQLAGTDWNSIYWGSGYVDVTIEDNSGSYYGQQIWFDIWNTILVTNNGTDLDGAINIQNLIDDLETQKAELQEEIEECTNIDTYDQVVAKQKLIDLKQAEIDGLNAVIDIIEIQLNQAKIALDNAVAQYETEDPSEDQPAEEQPAA